MLPLFQPEPLPLARKLKQKLSALADDGVFIGGSSWKYPGWLDQIYERENYLVRGRFSQKKFEQDCLSEYAAIFPVVCGDFSFYQFPSLAFWQKLFFSAPLPLRFALKVPEEVTVRTWPNHPRYGPRAGLPNENFLNAEMFAALFAEPLAPYRERIAALIFEFGAMRQSDDFPERLAHFLDRLPGGFRYSVEVRNAELLRPEYFQLLADRNVAHVLNAWTRMPELGHQIGLPGAFPADFSVVRALLRHGRPYDQAVQQFAPYTKLADPNPEGREAIRDVIRRAKREKQPTYLFINNRFEGNAPETIEAIVDEL